MSDRKESPRKAESRAYYLRHRERILSQRAGYYKHLDPADKKARKHRYGLKSRYGLLPAQYDAMLTQQQHKCKICADLFAPRNRPVVDHDHATKQVRGLLCTKCNSALGMFRDRVENLFAAFNYLENARGCR